MALFLGLMLLLLPFAFSLPTLAEDNSPEAVVNPDADQSPDTPGSGNELPQTPDSNSNDGNSETPAGNPDQPGTSGTPGSGASGAGTDGQAPANPGTDANNPNTEINTETPIPPVNPAGSNTDPDFLEAPVIPEIPVMPEEAGIDPKVPGIPPVKDALPDSFRKAPPLMSPGPSGIAINKENFPDDNFRKFLSDSKIDKNQDHFLSQDELSKIGTLFLYIPGPIEDLRGLEYLTFLEYLIGDATGKLDKIDVSPLYNLKEVTVGGA